MSQHGLMHRQAGLPGMLVVCMVICLAGCSLPGGRDSAGSMPDDELAASVVHLRCDEKPGQLDRLVRPGTVVVWLNTCAEDIRIVFPERTVIISCLNPVSFSINDAGIFASKMLGPGSVASLCFIQPGEYVYAVERPGAAVAGHADARRLEGVIKVK